MKGYILVLVNVACNRLICENGQKLIVRELLRDKPFSEKGWNLNSRNFSSSRRWYSEKKKKLIFGESSLDRIRQEKAWT